MSAATAGNRVTVLIVEDSEDQRHLLRRYFEMSGCDVVVAEDAESGMVAYHEETPDLAVVDLILPGMDGWTLTQHIRDARPEQAVAITSVLGSENYPPKTGALPKPVTRANVRNVLRNCVPRWAAS